MKVINFFLLRSCQSFRICGYANPASLRKFSEEDVIYIENFVRNELLNKLLDRCSRLKTTFNDDEKENFFGMYESSVEEFKLVRGDRHLLTEIASHLNKLYEEIGRDLFAQHFEPPAKFKIN